MCYRDIKRIEEPSSWLLAENTYLTTLLKQYTGIAKWILNIYEIGVYELREKNICAFEIIVKYMAVKKLKLKNLQKNNYFKYIPLHMM